LSWARKARQSSSRTPVSSHSLSRRQQVLGLPYRRGSSLQGAPVDALKTLPILHPRPAALGMGLSGRKMDTDLLPLLIG
jgi:hypothetical protein